MQSRMVTIFGSSSVGCEEAEYGRVMRLGRLLAQAGFVVCNGGYGGVMEASSRGAKEAGGRTLGITTRQFRGSRANPWIEHERCAKTWRERLFQLIDAGDGYVVCGGGTDRKSVV